MSNLRRRLLLDCPQYNKSEFEFGFDKVPSEVSEDKSYVHSIKGNSVKFNQHAKNPNFDGNVDNWAPYNTSNISVSYGNHSLIATSLVDGVGSYGYGVKQQQPTILGHKYLIEYSVKPSRQHIFFAEIYNANIGDTLAPANEWTRVKGVATAVNTSSYGNIILKPEYTAGSFIANETFEIKNVVVIDISDIFGTDAQIAAALGITEAQITTNAGVIAFEKWLAENVGTRDYYDYNPGTILNNKTEQVEVVGFNKWDEEWELGTFASGGVEAPSTTNIRNIGYIPVIPNTVYYFHCGSFAPADGTGYADVLLFDTNKQFLRYEPVSGYTGKSTNRLNIPANCAYIRFVMYGRYGTTYKNDVCINVSDSSKNGTYEPYRKITIPLNLTSLKGKLLDSQGQPTGSSIVISPNGLAGKDNWRDYCIIEGGYITKIVKKTGEVDLGDLAFIESSSNATRQGWLTDINNMLIPTVGSVSIKAISPLYKAVPNNITWKPGHMSNGGQSILFFVDPSAYESAAAFKAAMTGVNLVYELATPQTYLLDTPIPLTNRVDNGGTKRRLPEDTASAVSAPFSCEIAYDTINTNTNSIERVNASEEFIYDNISIDKPVKRGILTKIKGKSLVWNQVVSGAYSDQGITATMDTNGVIHLTGTTASIYFNPFITLYGVGSSAIRNCPLGKYYLHVEILNNPDSLPIMVSALNDRIQFSGLPADKTKSYSRYGICSNASASGGFGLSGFSSGTVFNDVQIQVSLINLTLMFGEGNEPATVAEFEKLYPLPYYNYNAGTLINNTTSALETVGFNLWDEEWESGYYDNNGAPVSSTSHIRSKNLIPVMPLTTYYLTKLNSASQRRFCFYDMQGNFVERGAVLSTNEFSVGKDIYFIKFHIEYYPAIYNHNICINLSNTSRNGEYEPYWKNIVNLNITSLTGKLNGEGNSVTIVPTGLKSAGTVYDYGVIEKGKLTKIVKCVGEVDLGTLSYEPNLLYGFYTTLNGVANVMTASCVCSKYQSLPGGSEQAQRGIGDKIVSCGKRGISATLRVYIKDSDYTDATTFKAAMSGVMLNYELKTPEVYILDNPVPVSLLTYKDCTVKQIPENTSTVVTATNVEVIKNQIH